MMTTDHRPTGHRRRRRSIHVPLEGFARTSSERGGPGDLAPPAAVATAVTGGRYAVAVARAARAQRGDVYSPVLRRDAATRPAASGTSRYRSRSRSSV